MVTGPLLGAAVPAPATPGGAVVATGGAAATAAGPAVPGRDIFRLQGVVVATGGEGGPVVELTGGRVVRIEGAPALRPLSRVEIQVPSGRLPEGEIVDASLVQDGAEKGQPGGAIPVRLRPAPAAPALLPARPGPTLPGTLALADGSGNAVEVRLIMAPLRGAAGGEVFSPAERPLPLAAALGALVSGTPVAALVLPRRQGERAALDVGGGLVIRLGRDAAGGLPQAGTVLVRLVGTPAPEDGDAAAALGRALAEEPAARGTARGPEPLPADAPRLGARLQALADGLDRDVGPRSLDRAEPVGGTPAAVAHAVLGDTAEPPTLRLARERDGGGGGAAGAKDGAGLRLVLDVAFARLGRFRLEVDRPGGSGAELRIALRGERPLPAGAHAELIDRVGAAFELGGARARFVVSTGALPSPPARTVVA